MVEFKEARESGNEAPLDDSFKVRREAVFSLACTMGSGQSSVDKGYLNA